MAAGGAEAEDALPTLDQILAAPSCFGALGLPQQLAEPGTVKARYRQLALRVHPDKCSDARAKQAFQKISEAFEALHTREAQTRYLAGLRRGGGRGSGREGGGRKAGGGTNSKAENKAWWDTMSWREFERRWRKREEMEAALKKKYMGHVQGKYQHRRMRQQILAAERSCEHLDRLRQIDGCALWPLECREVPNKAELQIPAFEGAKTAWDELMERHELEDPEHCTGRLVDLLTHLRTVHLYCLHCGCHFEDAEDMERSCPGFDEEAHENAESTAMARGAPAGVTRELAPPPKRPKGPAPRAAPREEEEEGDGDAFAALLLGGRRGGGGGGGRGAATAAGAARSRGPPAAPRPPGDPQRRAAAGGIGIRLLRPPQG